MRQTIEEALRIEREKVKKVAKEMCEAWGMEDSHGYSVRDTFQVGFMQGAVWQAKQSPWISVKERLPEQNKLVLCRMVSNGAIVSGYIFVSSDGIPRVATNGDFEFEDNNDYECNMWMPIPSFQ